MRVKGGMPTNLNDELIASGVTTRNTIGRIFDFGFGVGGPICPRPTGGSTGRSGNTAPRPLSPATTSTRHPTRCSTPRTLTGKAFIARRNWASGSRVTWQAAENHKLTYQYNGSYQCFCPQGPEFGLAPSGSLHLRALATVAPGRPVDVDAQQPRARGGRAAPTGRTRRAMPTGKACCQPTAP